FDSTTRLLFASGGSQLTKYTGPLGNVAFNPISAGKIVFTARLEPNRRGVDDTNDEAVWAGPAFSPQVVARKGQPVPGATSDRVFTGFGEVAANRDGKIAFVAHGTTDANGGDGILTGSPENLSLVVGEGDHVKRDGEIG